MPSKAPVMLRSARQGASRSIHCADATFHLYIVAHRAAASSRWRREPELFGEGLGCGLPSSMPQVYGIPGNSTTRFRAVGRALGGRAEGNAAEAPGQGNGGSLRTPPALSLAKGIWADDLPSGGVRTANHAPFLPLPRADRVISGGRRAEAASAIPGMARKGRPSGEGAQSLPQARPGGQPLVAFAKQGFVASSTGQSLRAHGSALRAARGQAPRSNLDKWYPGWRLLRRGACPRAARSADPWAPRNDIDGVPLGSATVHTLAGACATAGPPSRVQPTTPLRTGPKGT